MQATWTPRGLGRHHLQHLRVAQAASRTTLLLDLETATATPFRAGILNAPCPDVIESSADMDAVSATATVPRLMAVSVSRFRSISEEPPGWCGHCARQHDTL
jgi:hypothetical protein